MEERFEVGFDFVVPTFQLGSDAPVFRGAIEAYGGEQEWSVSTKTEPAELCTRTAYSSRIF